MMRIAIAALASLVFLTSAKIANAAHPHPLEIVADKPAAKWESEAYPIGNGRLGAMLFGGTQSARFQFNVDSLWTGDENPTGHYDEADATFGAYQNFGELLIELEDIPKESTTGYSRRLDLARGVHATVWQGVDGTRYRRETFASHPAEVIAIRLTADGPSRLNGKVRMVDAHDAKSTAHAGQDKPARITLSGKLDNDLGYKAAVGIQADQGKVSSRNDHLQFAGCRSLTLFLAADTDYVMDHRANWRGADPAPRVAAWLAAAEQSGWDDLLAAHEADFRELFDRVVVNLGRTPDEVRALSTSERITRHGPEFADPELEAMLFQFGRYLLISSSRENGLPANLQGLWNDRNDPAWHSDYHTNINIQMNYWLAEPSNLGECHQPLFALLDATRPACIRATRASFGDDTPGFTYRTSHNIFGGQGWKWNKPASAWYAMHFWEHYAFGRDEMFLRETAWPYFQGACEYWLHELKETPEGKLVAPDGWSPEHGPVEDGIAHDQQLIWQLFTNTLAAAEILGESGPLVTRIKSARERLEGPRIGKWGQLQEWIVDRDDQQDQHRHTSHLVAVFPGSQISVTGTPEFAKAATISLRARGESGDSRRSWTWPWRCALWARLRQPADCHRMIDGLLEFNTLSNFITTHPPLQLDGSFGITGGMCEMLLQSHAGEIDLLPGVDFSRWPTGSYQGLCARGGFEVSVQWENGRLVTAEILSTLDGPVVVRSATATDKVRDANGETLLSVRAEDGTTRFTTVAGERYRLSFDAP
ncbi:MAG: glycoside hydrolase family 95 protein [Aeoliella sp.]